MEIQQLENCYLFTDKEGRRWLVDKPIITPSVHGQRYYFIHLVNTEGFVPTKEEAEKCIKYYRGKAIILNNAFYVIFNPIGSDELFDWDGFDYTVRGLREEHERLMNEFWERMYPKE